MAPGLFETETCLDVLTSPVSPTHHFTPSLLHHFTISLLHHFTPSLLSLTPFTHDRPRVAGLRRAEMAAALAMGAVGGGLGLGAEALNPQQMQRMSPKLMPPQRAFTAATVTRSPQPRGPGTRPCPCCPPPPLPRGRAEPRVVVVVVVVVLAKVPWRHPCAPT